METEGAVVVHREVGPTIASPLTVYLDQNKWIELARAARSPSAHPARHDIFMRLAFRSWAREVLIPLSATNYIEVWHRHDWRSRYRLAQVMRDLSQYCTLSAAHVLLGMELDIEFQKRFGRPTEIRRVQPTGTGVRHAFAHPWGRLRFVESVYEDGQPEGSPIDPDPSVVAALRDRPALFEWMSLAGPDVNFPIPGLDHDNHRREGRAHAAEQAEFELQLDQLRLVHRRHDAVVLETLTHNINAINDAIQHACIDGRLLLEGGPPGISAFAASIPILNVLIELTYLRRTNRQQPWTANDLRDLISLAATIVYCDVVVTERQWVHLISRAKLDRQYSITVLNSLEDLDAII